MCSNCIRTIKSARTMDDTHESLYNNNFQCAERKNIKTHINEHTQTHTLHGEQPFAQSNTGKCISGMKSVLPHLIIIKSPKIALIIAQASYYRFVSDGYFQIITDDDMKAFCAMPKAI